MTSENLPFASKSTLELDSHRALAPIFKEVHDPPVIKDLADRGVKIIRDFP